MKDTIGRENRKLSDKSCLICGKVFRPVRESSKYCSRGCLWSQNGGRNKKPETWWINKRGYVEGRIWLPNGTQIRVKKHRFIMEGILDRPLLDSEDVHHKDGNKLNNDPLNLEVLDHSEHTRLSNKRPYKKGYKMNLTEAERRARSYRALSKQLAKMGREAIKLKKQKVT